MYQAEDEHIEQRAVNPNSTGGKNLNSFTAQDNTFVHTINAYSF